MKKEDEFFQEQNQENEINKENAKRIFSPKFIPFYPELMKFNLTYLDCLLYGFIDFYLANGKGTFYFTNSQLSCVFNCSEKTITRSLKQLELNNLIKVSRKIKAGGGQVRFVRLDKNVQSDGTSMSSLSGQSRPTNNNKINNNKINNTVKPKGFTVRQQISFKRGTKKEVYDVDKLN